MTGVFGFLRQLLEDCVERYFMCCAFSGQANSHSVGARNVVPDVLSEMVPGSGVLTSQLSSAALQAEASRTTARFSISNELSPTLQPYSIFWHNPGAIQAQVGTMLAVAIAQYNYYSEHEVYELRANAWLWQRLAVALAMMPLRWQDLNGSTLAANPTNDGIVHWSASQYPGGSSFPMPSNAYGEVPHTLQTSSFAVRDVVAVLLASSFGVQARPPAGPAFVAGISGASLVPAWTQCNYSATVSGGVAPLQYSWYLDQVQVGTGGTFSTSFGSAGGELALVVTDAANAVASASLFIQIDPYSSGCF